MNSLIDMSVPEAFVFMKVGLHAKETFDQILERKQREYDEAGMIFWGYGGSSCHPTKQVQPFVKSRLQKSSSGVYLVMQSIDSKADPKVLPATEYSVDNVKWQPIPKGINVTGSKYALVLEQIEPCDLEVDLGLCTVGIGNSIGKPADKYITGQNDKGCLILGQGEAFGGATKKVTKLGFKAKLKEPYSVFVKGVKNES